MRFWLVILMIVFAPLRGLAADVMAISMAVQQGAPSHHGVAEVSSAPAYGAAALSDCSGHHAVLTAPAPLPDLDAQAGPSEGDCPTCASCMVCSSAALAPASGLSPSAHVPHAVPAPRSTTFSSAAPLPGFKPPIS
jgi:hypothetical protein